MKHSSPATVTVRVVTHHCRECGEQVEDDVSCESACGAIVDSIITERKVRVVADKRSYTGRVRAVSAEYFARQLAQRAVHSGEWQYDVEHGGSVPNNYGYRTDTETVVGCAAPDGTVALWFSTAAANKVTYAGASAHLGTPAWIWDRRVTAAWKIEAGKAELRRRHAIAIRVPVVITSGSELHVALDCAFATLAGR